MVRWVMFYDDYVNLVAQKSLFKELLFMNLMQKQILLPPPLPSLLPAQ